MNTVRRAPARVVIALLLSAAFAALTVAPAQAAAYRYWGFYQLTAGKWAFAQKGPDQTTPADGSVEGWRFAVGDESSSRLPRAVLTFAQLCGSTPVQADSKRVGLVVDFGRPADAADGATPPQPKALCAVVKPAATSTDVLRAAGELRAEKGLICAVAGYPASDCGGAVKKVSAAAKAPDSPVRIALPSASASSSLSPSASPSASGSAGASTPSGAASPAAEAAGTAVSSTSGGSSVGTTIAYVVAALALLALIAFLVMRSRAASRRDA